MLFDNGTTSSSHVKSSPLAWSGSSGPYWGASAALYELQRKGQVDVAVSGVGFSYAYMYVSLSLRGNGPLHIPLQAGLVFEGYEHEQPLVVAHPMGVTLDHASPVQVLMVPTYCAVISRLIPKSSPRVVLPNLFEPASSGTLGVVWDYMQRYAHSRTAESTEHALIRFARVLPALMLRVPGSFSILLALMGAAYCMPS